MSFKKIKIQIINSKNSKTMTLIKFNNRLARKFDARPMFADFLNEIYSDVLTPESKLNSVPAVNITEAKYKFMVAVAAPGLSKEDFKINIENDVLTISAEKKEEVKEEQNNFSRREFSYTSFQRSFNLPETVNTENVNASYENGILTLNIPKKDEAKAKQVLEVKVS
jgi:HSP20 family protein